MSVLICRKEGICRYWLHQRFLHQCLHWNMTMSTTQLRKMTHFYWNCSRPSSATINSNRYSTMGIVWERQLSLVPWSWYTTIFLTAEPRPTNIGLMTTPQVRRGSLKTNDLVREGRRLELVTCGSEHSTCCMCPRIPCLSRDRFFWRFVLWLRYI